MANHPLTFVTLGGSITTGYAAPTPATGGWAALVAQGLKELVTQEVVHRNRGVSGTDSASAAVRVAAHADGADLVVLEFAVNDQWLDPTVRRQAYEGVVRQLLGLASRPRVLCLFLSEQEGPHKGQAAEQRLIAEHYGLPWVEAASSLGDPCWNDGDPIHPNAAGHRAIADAVLGALVSVLEAPSPAPANPRAIRDPLYSSDWQYARALGAPDRVPRSSRGWTVGSDVHHEWSLHGGAPSGWSTVADDAELVVTTKAKVVGVLYSESDGYRNLEARVDDGEWVTLAGHQESRKGYLGWAYRLVGRGLTGDHTLTIRTKADEWAHSGRPAHVVAVVEAGVNDEGLTLGDPATALADLTAGAPGTLPLVWTGRFDPAALPGARFGWQLTRLSGRFTGPTLGLAFSSLVDRNEVDVWVDGRSRLVDLNADSLPGVRLDGLGDGEHRLEVVKRSEGIFGSVVLDRLALAPGGRWLEAPARPPVRLEIYGDSITAGACNEDLAIDQYDHLARHDPQVGYAAIAARRLGVEVVNLAVSGTGLTCSWNPILMADVFDRVWPDPAAPVAAVDRDPQIVVVNLGQNDYGFPQSQGRSLSPDYGDRLVALVRGLRRRYPGAFLVGTLGGMTAVTESDDLRRQWKSAWDTVRRDDPRVRETFFRNATANHPRVDVHALLAEELTAFLAQEVLPHLETPPY